MEAILKLRAINGYIEPKQFKCAVNENLDIKLDTKLIGDFMLEWNGQAFKFTGKAVTISNEYIKPENTIFVIAKTKRFNCGKLFAEPYDTEMIEMLDIEAKYCRDIDRLMKVNEQLQTALTKMAELEKNQKEIIQKYNRVIYGVDIFEKE